MPKVTLHHIAIVVHDLDAAAAFFRDAFGIALEGAHDVEVEGVRVAFMPLYGDYTQHPPAIEIAQPTRGGTGVAKWLARHGAGMHHICIMVEDIHAAMARATQHGALLINDTPSRRDDGTLYAFVHPKSAFGVLIELYQV